MGTTKTSNILEDLETLRLFSRVIPEYCRNMDEKDILDNSFNLIFAFDEIVALGYRESVNLAQIRTFVEMDSHEEKVYNAVRETQMREAKNKMREKAKELQRQKLEAGKKGGKAGGMGSMGGMGGYTPSMPSSDMTPSEPPRPAYNPPMKPSSNKAMKLGGKKGDADSFVDQLAQEGVNVINNVAPVKTGMAKPSPTPQINTEAVHVTLEEKILLSAGRDGGLQSMEVLGLLTLRVAEDNVGRVKLFLQNTDNKAIQLQTHPNIDKDLFRSKCVIGLKNPAKPFPLNTGVGVLKWRLQTTDESSIPLSINCWPSDNGSGGCDVNIEFELENTDLELSDVTIAIPLPHGCGTPNISECEGDYSHDTRKQQLLWQHTIIDQNNKTGSMEFSCGGNPDDFFPVSVSFTSSKSYSGIQVLDCSQVDGGDPVKFSSSVQFFAEKYEIV